MNSFLARELAPFPGRATLTARIVFAVLLAAVMTMAFRVPLGWLGLYFCIALAKPSTKETLFVCTALLGALFLAILTGLLMLKFAAEPAWLRLLLLTLVLFSGFYLARALNDGDLARDFTIALAIVLTLPDVFPYPHLWEQAALRIVQTCLVGIVSIAISSLLFRPERHDPRVEGDGEIPALTLAPDFLTNPAYASYAAKGTLAAMACYALYTACQFQQIHTAIVTCLIVAMPTTGLIMRKIKLRIVGAACGVILAMASVIWIIPANESFATLLLILAVGSSIAAWVAVGSERIAYAGWQIGLAQFMMLTHGFGPTTDLKILRDRLIGIILGNLLMALAFGINWSGLLRHPATGRTALALLVATLPATTLTACRSPSPSPAPSLSADAPPPAAAPAPMPLPAPGQRTSLDELMRIALANRPESRIAWAKWKIAAASVDAARSAYLPTFALDLLAGVERTQFPLPASVLPQGSFNADFAAFRPQLAFEWILLDFGRRSAATDAAMALESAESLAYQAHCQQVMLEVSKAYFDLLDLQDDLRVVEAALEDATSLEEAASLGLDAGLSSKQDVFEARRYLAEYRFDHSALRGKIRTASARLAEQAGIDPRHPLVVKNYADIPLPPAIDEPVGQLVENALSDRPDLKARMAELRAAEAAVREAEADFLPSLVASGNAGPSYDAFRVEGYDWVNANEPIYAVGVALRWPFFDGGRRSALLAEAEALAEKASAQVESAKNRTIREVWSAYTDYRSAREKLESARAWVDAATLSFDSALTAFRNGTSPITDVTTRQTGLAKSRAAFSKARNDVFLALAAVQAATGSLTSPSAR